MAANDSDESTATATGIGVDGPSAPDEGAGLVLLYAAEHASLPAVFPVPASGVVIGRSAPANIVLPQHSVSRMHARVWRTADGYVLRDLDSRNGVVVGGVRVSKAVLRHGDVIHIGDALFKFVAHDAAAYAPYRVDGALLAGARPVTIPGAAGGMQMARVSATIATAAPTDIAVLVSGETGTGKELVARALHAASGRAGAFVPVNCAAIPATLLESELFGFKRGAFSGATRDHAGLFRAASGGTLLLDEIGELPLEAQAKLLRVLETREVQPIGGVRAERVDARVVAATHRDLRALVAAGAFRGDLYARLNGFPVAIPPLRERKEDLFMLVRHVLREAGAPDRGVTFRFMAAACAYDWPYNVRELVAAVRRAASLSAGGPLDASALPEDVTARMADYGRAPTAPAPTASPVARGARPSGTELVELLKKNRGNVAAVARELGKDRAQVHRWIQQLGIDADRFR